MALCFAFSNNREEHWQETGFYHKQQQQQHHTTFHNKLWTFLKVLVRAVVLATHKCVPSALILYIEALSLTSPGLRQDVIVDHFGKPNLFVIV